MWKSGGDDYKARSIDRYVAGLACVMFAASTCYGGSALSVTTLSGPANPTTYGQRVTLTALVSPASATGIVTFYNGVFVVGIGAVNGGQASASTIFLPPGRNVLHAYYGGDANDQPSTSTSITQTVNGVAEAGFLPASRYSTGIDPIAVAIGDFNGDGKADFAVANALSGSNDISVLLGNGDGTFKTAVSYPADAGPVALAVGDFNGDGKPDLVVVNQSSNDVSVLIGDGNGTFQPPVNYGTPTGPSSVTVTDVNGDGLEDLVVTTSATVTVLLGHGDGSFVSVGAYPMTGVANAAAVGDFNGDGKVDIAVASSNSMSVLLGNGDGSFQPAVNYGSNFNQSVVVADFNGDGNADLAVSSFNGAYFFSVMLGNGDGTFQPPINTPLSGIPYSMTTADFNVDGTPDLAVATFQTGGAGGNVNVFIGSGDGTFHTPVSYTAGTQPYSIAAADFNGDGEVDLAATQLNGGSVYVLLGTANAPPPSPAVDEGGVINSASFAKDVTGRGSPVAPGSLVSIFGSFPGAVPQAAQTVPLPPSLGSVSVTFNGVPAPLSLVYPNGAFPFITAQLPFGVLPGGQTAGTANVVVTVNGVASSPKTVSVTPAAPGIFTIPPTGLGNAVLVFSDPTDQIYKIAAPASASATFGYPTAPVPRGQPAYFYATGLGAMSP
ncbi:MAG: FG-GAP-like repeat-containing protein, partial [Bryobacteraceae bacterium]